MHLHVEEGLKMRIMKGRSKDPTYHVIRDVRRNGVRSTEIMENLGSASEICRKYNVTDADAWAREYVQKLRDEEKGKVHKVLIPFNTDVIIDRDEQLLYNAGYLFLQRLSTESIIILVFITSSGSLLSAERSAGGLPLSTISIPSSPAWSTGAYCFPLRSCPVLNSHRNCSKDRILNSTRSTGPCLSLQRTRT